MPDCFTILSSRSSGIPRQPRHRIHFVRVSTLTVATHARKLTHFSHQKTIEVGIIDHTRHAYRSPDWQTFVRTSYEIVADPLVFLAECLMEVLFSFTESPVDTTERPTHQDIEDLEFLLTLMSTDGLDCTRYRGIYLQLEDADELTLALIRSLLDLYLDIGLTSGGGYNRITYWMLRWNNAEECEGNTGLRDDLKEDILATFIKAGIDPNHHNYWDQTASIMARSYSLWPIWCRALEREGYNLERVLAKEGSLWLLDADYSCSEESYTEDEEEGDFEEESDFEEEPGSYCQSTDESYQEDIVGDPDMTGKGSANGNCEPDSLCECDDVGNPVITKEPQGDLINHAHRLGGEEKDCQIDVGGKHDAQACFA